VLFRSRAFAFHARAEDLNFRARSFCSAYLQLQALERWSHAYRRQCLWRSRAQTLTSRRAQLAQAGALRTWRKHWLTKRRVEAALVASRHRLARSRVRCAWRLWRSRFRRQQAARLALGKAQLQYHRALLRRGWHQWQSHQRRRAFLRRVKAAVALRLPQHRCRRVVARWRALVVRSRARTRQEDVAQALALRSLCARAWRQWQRAWRTHQRRLQGLHARLEQHLVGLWRPRQLRMAWDRWQQRGRARALVRVREGKATHHLYRKRATVVLAAFLIYSRTQRAQRVRNQRCTLSFGRLPPLAPHHRLSADTGIDRAMAFSSQWCMRRALAVWYRCYCLQLQWRGG
jgi:hypothetical protein